MRRLLMLIVGFFNQLCLHTCKTFLFNHLDISIILLYIFHGLFHLMMYSFYLCSFIFRVDDSIGKFVGFASQLHLLVNAFESSGEAQFLEDFVAG